MNFYEGLLPATQTHTAIWLAQVERNIDIAQTVPVPVATPVPVQGPQFFIAVLSGVILAFGFQLLLTNLSMAAGVSYVAHSSSSSSSDSSSGTGIKKIGLAFGVWTLVTVSLSLFFACWLAVKLSIYPDPWTGAVTGLIIWALYFSLLTWFSSTAVGSLIGSVVKSATNGFQAIVGTATAALGASTAGNEIVQTAEAAAAAVRRELTTGLDTRGIQDSLQDYFSSLRSPEVDVVSVEREFEQLLHGSEISNLDPDSLPQVSPQMFAKLLSDRTNLSREETKRVANRLYKVWQRNTGGHHNGMGELMAFVASATGGQLASEGISRQLEKLTGELRHSQGRSNNETNQGPSPMQQVMSQSANALIGMVMGKADLSDIDAGKIVDQIKSAKNEVINQASNAAPKLSDAITSDSNIIKADVENYLHHAYIVELKSAELAETFRNVLYDTEADKATMREQISAINRKVFVDALKSRGLLTQSEIHDIATRLDLVRQAVLNDVVTVEAIEAEKRVRQKVETFFKYSPASELTSEMGEQAFRALIEDESLDAVYLRDRLGSLNADYFRQFLVSRNDVQAHAIADRYEQVLNRVIADAEGIQQAAKVRLEQQQKTIEDYLRDTGKRELSPEGIKRDIKMLLNEPNQGLYQARQRVAQFDRDTLVQLLSQRPEFAEGEINQVIDSVEDSWMAAVHAPAKLTAQAQAKYDEATTLIEDYLRSTGKPELSPEGIKRDLQKLMDNPKVGARAIRFRLSKMDRDTFVQLLSQRDDLSEADVNQVIDSVITTVESLVKLPRRLARRTQSSAKSQTLSFQSALTDYLSNTNKEELNPNGIQRDLKLLLNDPKLGVSKLGDRISEMDDSTMVALLAQRPDMSEEEAREVVGRIAEVRHQIKNQIRDIQRSVESVIDRIFGRIRQYLESLDRPELNYVGIKRDVQTMFDDPQAGMDAMRDRLSQFDRNTLVALVSSHESISEADAYRVIDQVESARDSVLHKAERIEQQIESRLHSIKAQTQQQIEDTKVAAEAAAWWLFGTALISAIVAAVGGSLAV
ncbi:MAG: MFS transporter [Cyanobacteria bacterium J06581_3]